MAFRFSVASNVSKKSLKVQRQQKLEVTNFGTHAIEIIRKLTLSSPCLWASFDPLSPL
jgi:hypothetical protein